MRHRVVQFHHGRAPTRKGRQTRTRHRQELIVSAVIAALVASAATFAAPDSRAQSYLYFKVKSPVAKGQLALVVVQGLTGLCRLSVSKAGSQMRVRPLRINPLRPKLSTAAGDARISWQWWVPTTTPLGLWHVRVNCGRSAPLHGTLLVTP
jgi:hypothetical protein